MAEHPTLEARLRGALGGGGAGAGGFDGVPADLDAARARVVRWIRLRRARRLRAAGGTLTALVALAIAMPLVLVTGAAPTRSHPSRPPVSSAAPGLAPTSTPPRFGPIVPPAVFGTDLPSTPRSTGRCLSGTRTVTPCGHLATGAAAGQAGATDNSPSESSTGSRVAAAPAHAPLHVHVGRWFEITLPRVAGRTTWSIPTLAESYHGRGAPLEVQRSARTRVPRAGWQGFVVRAAATGTFELQAHARPSASVRVLPTGAGPGTTWTLMVEVTGKGPTTRTATRPATTRPGATGP